MQAMMTMTPPVIGLPCCRWWLKDSQFFHLVGEKYLRAATWCGATPILLPALGDDAPLAHWLEMVDGLLFTGSANTGYHLHKQLAGAPENAPKILLAHQPRSAHAAAR